MGSEAVSPEASRAVLKASESDTSPDVEKLRAYTRAKHALAGHIRALHGLLRQGASETRAEQCRELMAKLAEDRFTLAVLGEFKRGKSSLMNAIIGRDLLPTGVLPVTSAITVLKFGSRERLVVHNAGSAFPREYPVSDLSAFVTERGNPSNEKAVSTACLELPHPFLRRGLEFVDTPGVGSSIEANTTTTYSFLPQCDAALFVTSVEAALTASEIEFLQRIREHARKLFFVVNKVDLVGDRERQEVLGFTAAALKQHLGADAVRLFPVSSRLGLASRLAGDGEGYARSGVKDLEAALVDFLSNEKAATFLESLTARALRLLDEEVQEIRLHHKARAASDDVVRARQEQLRQRWREHAQERHELIQRMGQHLMRWAADAVAPDNCAFLEAARAQAAVHVEAAIKEGRWRTARRVARALARRVAEDLRARGEPWAAAQQQRLSGMFPQAASEHWARVTRNLGAISAIAAEVMDVPAPQGAPAGGPGNLDVTVRVPNPFAAGAAWAPRVPFWSALLPARVVRGPLTGHLDGECGRFLESCSATLQEAVASGIAEAVRGLGDLAGAWAAEAEAHILEAIAGKNWRESRNREAAVGDAEAALNSLRTQLLGMRPEVVPSQPSAPTLGPAPAVDTSAPASPPADELPAVRPPEPRIAKAIRTRGCPVCQHMTQTAFDFLASWQHRLAQDEAAQQQFAAGLGFCAPHTWQLEAMASPHGLSLGYTRLVQRLSQELPKAAVQSEAGQAVRALMSNPGGCRVCQLARESERVSIERLASFLNDEEGQRAYAKSQGVCLRHLVHLVEKVQRQKIAQAVIHQAARRFQEAAEDMQNYAMKHDGIRRWLQN
ncbi:MAG TPA: dynamin family protein, partial [Planctomycetota bacterium]|nr:dynamin family protein [Planctomycetota bacterium]